MEAQLRTYDRGYNGGSPTGETCLATILFSDIRSFSTLSQRLAPASIVEMLNEYFNEMVDIVLQHCGHLDKFIGDALMAVFNVPKVQRHAELHAVQTALDMLRALDRINGKRAQRGLDPLRIGIGINTGPVIAGSIGHRRRLEYTVIGDAVNLASRIESQTKVAGHSLLVSESTYRAVRAHVIAHALPPVRLKGRAELVTMFAIAGMRAGAEVACR